VPELPTVCGGWFSPVRFLSLYDGMNDFWSLFSFPWLVAAIGRADIYLGRIVYALCNQICVPHMRPLTLVLPSITRPMLRIYKAQKYFKFSTHSESALWVLSTELGVGPMNNYFLQTR